ncbi:MAG: preprotein translocase subunit SecD [Sphingomonadales bacterium]|jgi:preprotein translocase subunit SecD|nr:preprotein translocase subunit SecD [Sphingomonadales bacterium]
MLDFPRWKRLAISFALALGVLFAIPSLIGEGNAKRFGLGAMPRISLGLDLSGGSHILLEADVNDVAKTRIAAMEETIRSQIRRSDPPIDIGDVSTANGSLSFFVRNPAQVDAAVELARRQTAGVGATGQRDWDVNVVDGNRVVMTPTRAGIDAFINEAMNGATDVVRKRIDALGTREPTIVRQGSDRILVEVPGFQDPAALKALIGRTAKLEFKLVDLNINPTDLQAGRAPIGSQILKYENGAPIAVQRRAIINGSQLVKAQQSYDQNNQPTVSITFNSEGGHRFAEVTQQNVNKPFAIILDNVVLSAPNINEPILGGSAQIMGNFTVDSAQQLAIALQSGSLPVALKVVEERTVGPQLGADSIHAGILASVIAAVAIVIFMLLTYGRFGVYANIAVILNIFIILSVMAMLTMTLTLPGIAGFVLTIGTAVDANVLINERIREELRRGRNVVMAVELGYKEASRTIFEANATHAISGIVMLLLGSGPIKGFAVVLLIGIVTSVFTAVTFTRMLTAGYIRRRRPAELHI